MPRLTDSMQEGTILRWLRHAGDVVRRGEPLAEIETDKATTTFEADADGVLEPVAAEGETLPVGAVIARIAVDGAQDAGRVMASPLARAIAREQGVDLQGVEGTGPGGRIVRADVEAAATPEVPTLAETGTSKGDVSILEPTRAQRSLARRMAEAKATVPELTLTTEIDVEGCVRTRAQLDAMGLDVTPTIDDMVIKAAGLALRELPRANGSYKDGHFELYSRVNVSVAVATEDNLVFPTVFDADDKALRQIARETRAAAEKVRAGTITPPEVSGGTFTVSSLGAYGTTAFAPIITTPQAAVLAVGAPVQRPTVVDGEVAVRHVLHATLVCDSRILFGAGAAQLLARIRELLEQPASLYL